MAIVSRKPRNSSLRFQTFLSSKDITETKPTKGLVVGLKRKGGRNAYGRITMRHHGGGAAKLYRIVDFKRNEHDLVGRVTTIEYDPNRNVRIGLVVYPNGVKKYILLPEGLTVGSSVVAGEKVEPTTGNCLPLKNIPVGFFVHNVEMNPGRGGKLVRSAGCSAQIIGKNDDFITLKMPSNEVRLINADCWATVGVLGNADYKNISWGKAGRTRHLGFRPSVRGMAMNPVDHPHGGGEGRSKSGSHPVTPWGKGCKGARTRKRKDFRIIRRRK